MKNIYRYIILLAALLTSSTVLKAQMNPGEGLDGVVFNKEVHEGTVPNSYELTIDAFVTGTTQTTEETVPCDIMLVLDVSTSMSASQYSNGKYFTLGTPQELTTGDNIGILHTDQSGSNNYSNNHDSRLRYQIKIGNETYNLLYHDRKWFYGKGTSWDDKKNPWTEYTTAMRSANDTIYTDVKIDLLQKAVNDFIATVRTNAVTNKVDHKIGVATYCGSLTQYCDITDVKNGEFTVHTGKTTTRNVDMTDFVNDLHNHMGGSTNHYLGFQQAETLYKNLYGGNTLEDALKSEAAEGRSQVVVFFTDGDPNSDQKKVVTNTIESSYNFKKNNVKVYSIGVFTDTNIGSISPAMKLSQFLDYVSSDYPNAETYGKYGAHIAKEDGKDHKFYFKAEGADLSSIFTTIAEESSKADIKLTATSTSVIDIISESFVIPEDTPDGEYDGTKYGMSQTGNAIGLYVAPVTGYSNGQYTFGTEVLAKTAKDGNESICPDVKAIVAGDKLTVTGFDYSKYCVAEVEGSNPKQYKGYKLSIKIKIEINPANPGGADVPTNKIGSGIYYEGKQIAEFQQPDVKIPNIIIIKKGLKKGESATFTVSGNGLSPMVLVATCKADGADAIAKAKIQKPGRYTVTENTWSWAYDLSTLVKDYAQEDDTNKTVVDEDARSITRNVNEATENSDYHGTLFIFENAAKENMPDHGESYKLNVFYEQNTNK